MKIPCTIMRGGTSKGIILRSDTLPSDPLARDSIILKIFGSPDRRQIDGLAGADPLTSKVALVGPASRADADIDYTFADVLIEKPVVDYSGYCGNVTSAVAAYAVDEGFLTAVEPVTVVRIHNTNTQRIIRAQVTVRDGRAVEIGDVEIAGVPGTAAPIYLDFADTAGSISGTLLPAGTSVELRAPSPIRASIVDIGNPMVFVRAGDFGVATTDGPDELNARQDLLARLEEIRVQGAQYLGLVRNGRAVSASIPAVALVAGPADYQAYSSKRPIAADSMDFWSREIFIGSVHKAYGVSETVCSTVAALIPGTVVHDVSRAGAAARGRVRLGHPSGVIEARVAVDLAGVQPVVNEVSVVRTARRIMDGMVYVP
jgi:2-methylaconitate cis-trans-isomerase PrpF